MIIMKKCRDLLLVIPNQIILQIPKIKCLFQNRMICMILINFHVVFLIHFQPVIRIKISSIFNSNNSFSRLNHNKIFIIVKQLNIQTRLKNYLKIYILNYSKIRQEIPVLINSKNLLMISQIQIVFSINYPVVFIIFLKKKKRKY